MDPDLLLTKANARAAFIESRSLEILTDDDPRLDDLAWPDDPEALKRAAIRLATEEWDRDISEPSASDLMAFEARLRGEE